MNKIVIIALINFFLASKAAQLKGTESKEVETQWNKDSIFVPTEHVGEFERDLLHDTAEVDKELSRKLECSHGYCGKQWCHKYVQYKHGGGHLEGRLYRKMLVDKNFQQIEGNTTFEDVFDDNEEDHPSDVDEHRDLESYKKKKKKKSWRKTEVCYMHYGKKICCVMKLKISTDPYDYHSNYGYRGKHRYGRHGKNYGRYGRYRYDRYRYGEIEHGKTGYGDEDYGNRRHRIFRKDRRSYARGRDYDEPNGRLVRNYDYNHKYNDEDYDMHGEHQDYEDYDMHSGHQSYEDEDYRDY